ncbi:MAG: hypothetical protein M1834_006017 [Cirrosporium novae-zelandiae]|nr:MAG: hypothetical protein M1834_006017 [Cirrosporium novae-zelandiae]
MTWWTGLASLQFPRNLPTSPVPQVGDKAPADGNIILPIDGKYTIITFLRHCGCPFAEKTFLDLRSLAASNPSVQFVAVSHSDELSTNNWLSAVGGAGSIKMITDPERELYAGWGLGVSSWFHFLSPTAMWSAYQLAKDGITNRPTESGNRWQTAGSFAVDQDDIVRYAHVAQHAGDVPDFEKVLELVDVKGL